MKWFVSDIPFAVMGVQPGPKSLLLGVLGFSMRLLSYWDGGITPTSAPASTLKCTGHPSTIAVMNHGSWFSLSWKSNFPGSSMAYGLKKFRPFCCCVAAALFLEAFPSLSGMLSSWWALTHLWMASSCSWGYSFLSFLLSLPPCHVSKAEHSYVKRECVYWYIRYAILATSVFFSSPRWPVRRWGGALSRERATTVCYTQQYEQWSGTSDHFNSEIVYAFPLYNIPYLLSRTVLVHFSVL